MNTQSQPNEIYSKLQRLSEPEEQQRLQSDAELLERYCSAGDRCALEALVRRYSAMVASVCSLTVSDPASAEDAFQATFLVLLQSAQKIRRRASLAAWLHGVAYRCACRLRKQKRDQLLREGDADVIALEPQFHDPVAQLARQMDLEALDRELERLPESLRAPLVEFYLLGYSAPQIAERMELSLSAVEGRLRRGRHVLRAKLAQRGISLAVLIAGSSLFQQHLAASEAECWVQLFLDSYVPGGEGTLPNLTRAESANPQVSSLVRGETSMFSSVTLKTAVAASVVLVTSVCIGLSVYADGSDDGQAGRGAMPTGTVLNLTAAAQPPEVMAQLAPVTAPQAPAFTRKFPEDKQPAVEWSRPETTEASEPAWLKNVGDEMKTIEANRLVLSQKVAIDLNAAPLQQLARELTEKCGIEFELNATEIELGGLADIDTPITLKTAAPVREILRRALSQHELTYIVRESTIEITTKDDANQSPDTRYYDLSYVLPNAANMSALITAIQQAIEPLDWDTNGGTANISMVGSIMVVSAPDTTHRDIEIFLANIARMSPQNARQAAPMPAGYDNAPGGMF